MSKMVSSPDESGHITGLDHHMHSQASGIAAGRDPMPIARTGTGIGTTMPHTVLGSEGRRLPFDPFAGFSLWAQRRLDLYMHLAGCYALLYFLYQRKLQTELDDWKQMVHHLKRELHRTTRAGRQQRGTHTMYQLIEHDDLVEVRRSDIVEVNRRLHHCAQELHEVREHKRQVEEEYRVLASRMERVESLHAQQFQADSGSYQDSTPTPPLLQIAADAAKDAIISCASELYTITKSSSIPINFQHAIPNYKLDLQASSKPTFIKKALQEYFCNLFFWGFESATFSFSSGGAPQFQKPESRKRELFQEYKDCRYIDPEKMWNEHANFGAFTNAKASCLWSVDLLMMGDQNQARSFFEEKLFGDHKNKFSMSFLRLARAVWALHKLAFAFEPSAEIFRVGHGSTFDEDYMEDLGQADEDEGDDNSMNSRAKNVELVCAPGFTVRNSVVKARVWLSEEPSLST